MESRSAFVWVQAEGQGWRIGWCKSSSRTLRYCGKLTSYVRTYASACGACNMWCGMIRVAEPRLAWPSRISRQESGSVAAPWLLSAKHSILSLYVILLYLHKQMINGLMGNSAHWNQIRHQKTLLNSLPHSPLRTRSRLASIPPYSALKTTISSLLLLFILPMPRITRGRFALKASYLHMALSHFVVEVLAFSKPSK